MREIESASPMLNFKFSNLILNSIIVIDFASTIKILDFKILPHDFSYRNLHLQLYNPISVHDHIAQPLIDFRMSTT